MPKTIFDEEKNYEIARKPTLFGRGKRADDIRAIQRKKAAQQKALKAKEAKVKAGKPQKKIKKRKLRATRG